MIWIILLFSSITFAQLNTYDLIMEYEQECYADSTRHEDIKPCYSLVYPPCPGHSYDPPVYYWIHKDPTWGGFREFVKKRRLTIHLLK